MNYLIYTDESSVSTGRYMVIGGLIIPENYEAELKKSIEEKIKFMGLTQEVSWENSRKSTHERYISLIEEFILLIYQGKMCFRAVIVDKYEYDSRKYNNKSDTPFYKIYTLFLFHKFCKRWYRKDKIPNFIVHPDEKSTNKELYDLKNYINKMCYDSYRTPELVKEIKPQVSKENVFIQMIDLYIGCLSYYANDYHKLPSAAAHKVKIYEQVKKICGIQDLRMNISKLENRYEIWNFKFNK